MKNYLDRLSTTQRQDLLSAGALVRYGKRELIHSRGDHKVGVSIVGSGAAYTGVYGDDGGFLLTAILGPGQIFGEFTLFAGLPRTHDISAVGETEIYQIPGPVFERLCDREPAYLKALLSLSLERLHTMLELSDALRRLPLPVRLARTIQILLETGHEDNQLSYRQSDLAVTLGVTRQSLSRALRQLEAERLVESGYGVIRVPDAERLRNWVAERSFSTSL